MQIIALALSTVSVLISGSVAISNYKNNKAKQSPIFFISNSFENRIEGYIDLDVINLSDVTLNKFKIDWRGTSKVEIESTEVLNDKNNFNYKIRIDISKLEKTKNTSGTINITTQNKCKNKFKFKIEVDIISKHYDFEDTYMLELDTKLVHKRVS